MSLRTVRTVAGRAFALLVAGLVVVVLGLSVVVPRLGGAETYTILTGSMRPTMPPGTMVAIRPTAPEKIGIGDVLTYQLRSGDPTVATHRVVGIGNNMRGEFRFTLQGDANNGPDAALVRPEQIKGVRWYGVPYLGYPSLLIGVDTRQTVVMGAVVLLFGYAAVSFAGAARDARRRRNPDVATPDRELTGALS